MAYATIDDIFAAYPPIKSIVGSSDLQVSSVDVNSYYITNQESLIDGYLARRYTVPLTNPTPLIRGIATDLALFDILTERLPESPDWLQDRYNRRIKQLEQIQEGMIVVNSATEATNADQEAWSSTMDYHPVFSPVLDPIDQAVDKDQVDADKDDRASD